MGYQANLLSPPILPNDLSFIHLKRLIGEINRLNRTAARAEKR
jgi:hypothetical protein